MNRTAILALLILCPAGPAAAAGTAALPFLKLDQGAAAAAMGGAYCASGGGDAWGVFYNPAEAALAARRELALGHNEWVQGIRNETAVYLSPLSGGAALYGGLNALFSGGMDKYDEAGAKTGTFSSREAALLAGGALPLGRDWYGGAALKGLYQAIPGETGYALGGDAGLLKRAGDWTFGASASNFGSAMKLASASAPLPLVLRAGAAWELPGRLRLEADLVKPGESAVAPAAGAEASFRAGPDAEFFLRAGFSGGRSDLAGPGAALGLGLRNGDLRLDYAFSPYGDLGDSHRVTVALTFGAPVRGKAAVRRAVPARRPARGGKTGNERKKRKEEDGSVYFIW